MRFALSCALASLYAALPAAAQEPGAQADAYFDREAMAAARAALRKEHGRTPNWFLIAERLEYQSNDGAPALLFEGQGWWGTDRNKLWVKSEVHRDFDAGRFEDAELQALWSRPVSRFFDLQAGVRHDFVAGADRTFGVIGVQGLAPYWFEIDAAVFVSGEGDISARFEAEYDLLLTQRLILQPRTELNFAVQDVEEIGVGAGLSAAEIGVRLRYEIRRQFAPYVGVNWERAVGESADFARANGENVGAVSAVAGVRLWF
jgi:copper resistance protein B